MSGSRVADRLKDPAAAADKRGMEAMSTNRPATSDRRFQLPQVPVPIWVVGVTGWVLAFRRLFAELLG